MVVLGEEARQVAEPVDEVVMVQTAQSIVMAVPVRRQKSGGLPCQYLSHFVKGHDTWERYALQAKVVI
jgi:hypothetical protein